MANWTADADATDAAGDHEKVWVVELTTGDDVQLHRHQLRLRLRLRR